MKVEVLTDYLLRISEGKLQLINSLLDLTGKQRDRLQSVEEEEIATLDNLIQQKQDIMNKIDLLDQEFLDKFQILKGQLGINSFAELTEEPVVGIKVLRERIQEILHITEKIREIDQENARKAKGKIEQIKQQLKTVKIGKKANHGYGKKFNEIHSILIDKKK